MSEIELAEAMLANFLDVIKNKELSTWNKKRTPEELVSFIDEKLSVLDYKEFGYN